METPAQNVIRERIMLNPINIDIIFIQLLLIFLLLLLILISTKKYRENSLRVFLLKAFFCCWANPIKNIVNHSTIYYTQSSNNTKKKSYSDRRGIDGWGGGFFGINERSIDQHATWSVVCHLLKIWLILELFLIGNNCFNGNKRLEWV